MNQRENSTMNKVKTMQIRTDHPDRKIPETTGCFPLRAFSAATVTRTLMTKAMASSSRPMSAASIAPAAVKAIAIATKVAAVAPRKAAISAAWLFGSGLLGLIGIARRGIGSIA